MNAVAKGKMSLPVTKPPEEWMLNAMIDWITSEKNKKIITDKAVLNYLRQIRNNRAHGGVPSIEERHMLMIGVQYLAGLYIDYIELLDDLTQDL